MSDSLGSMNSVFTDHHKLWWTVYEAILVVFFIIFLGIYGRGKHEYRPITHQHFERLRLTCLVSIFVEMLWSIQFYLDNNEALKIVSIIGGSISRTIISIVVCIVITEIFTNYFDLNSKKMPSTIKYYVYFWCIISIIQIFCQLLSYSLDTDATDKMYLYSIYVYLCVNCTFLAILFAFLVLFLMWLLTVHHRFSIVDDKLKEFGGSDITVGGEYDVTGQRFLCLFIFLLCGFIIYFGCVISSNLYFEKHHIYEAKKYGVDIIIMHYIIENTVLYIALIIYLLPRTDNYYSVSTANILKSIHINTESNRQKKGTFKDPDSVNKWEYHANDAGFDNQYSGTHNGDMDDDFTNEYISSSKRFRTSAPNLEKDNDTDSNVSYTTLMYRHSQRQKRSIDAIAAKSPPKIKALFSYFHTPTHSNDENESDEHDENEKYNLDTYDEARTYRVNINVNDKKTIHKKRKKKQKAPRIRKSKYLSNNEEQNNESVREDGSLSHSKIIQNSLQSTINE